MSRLRQRLARLLLPCATGAALISFTAQLQGGTASKPPAHAPTAPAQKSAPADKVHSEEPHAAGTQQTSVAHGEPPHQDPALSRSWKGPIPTEFPKVLEQAKTASAAARLESTNKVWDKINKDTLKNLPLGPSKDPDADRDPDSPADSSLNDHKEALLSDNLEARALKRSDAQAQRFFQQRIEEARGLRRSGGADAAVRILSELLQGSGVPESFQKSAMIELALAAQSAKQFVKAQQIYEHYRKTFGEDSSLPEIMLRQGLLYRDMGANGMALSKFYAVMTMALNYRTEHLEYYQRLVLHAQTEIADTHFLQGKYDEAAGFFRRLLQLESTSLNMTLLHYKLVRSLAYLESHAELVASANQFLARYPGAEEQAEVRFLLAMSLKALGRVRDSIQQVNLLLESQQANAEKKPEIWLYWQQRTGNEIANQLFKEGDYANALELYLNLVQLDKSAEWQAPILYQVGLVYERMGAPSKAADTYSRIASMEAEITAAGHVGVKEVLAVARWRKDFLNWDLAAQNTKQQLIDSRPTPETGKP